MSVGDGIIERMFGSGSQLHDYWEPPDTPASRALIDTLVASTRHENQAAACRLKAVGDLFEMRRAERGEAEDWAVDTWAAVGAEIAAALRVSLGKAGSFMNYGLAMLRLPAVAAVFAAGDIGMDAFRTISYRTGNITDEAVMAEVDRRIAVRSARWPSMTQGRLSAEIDRIVARLDPDAIRRTRDRAQDREVTVWDNGDGLAELSGRLFSTDAQLLDKQLDALAGTVCESDPRTVAQRRADALGALAARGERLMCQCGAANCPAAVGQTPAVVIHVVADQSTLDGTSDNPGYLVGADSLISAELLRDLAETAKLRPLVHPGDSDAEPRYQPSRALADFVRFRDLTCRAPGCDRPAVACDLDHTVPYAAGGPTHAGNLKCLCRVHHLLKTFWGWRDRQLPDGTVIWNLPDGHTYVTTPGSALLFPTLSAPTGPLFPSPATPADKGDRSALMPLRKSTRSQNRAHRIATERAHSRAMRLQACPPPSPGDEPPPF